MIPKIIHYCWFGGKPLPNDVKSMIATWRRHCPDYEIIEWNESNFDVDEIAYSREAHTAKKWAFVSDYVRMKVLYQYGGFYLDTDVELIQSLDDFCCYDTVLGYESPKCISTAVIGVTPSSEWISKMLSYYDASSFRLADGKYNLTTNVRTISRILTQEYNLNLNGKRIFLDNAKFLLLPYEYLCAKSYLTGEINKTSNTYAIHHFSGSWLSDIEKGQSELRKKYNQEMSWIPFPGVREKIASARSVYKTEGMKGVKERILKIIRSI